MVDTFLEVGNSKPVQSCMSSAMKGEIRGCCLTTEYRRFHEVLHCYGSSDYSTRWRSSSHCKIDTQAAKPMEDHRKVSKVILVVDDWLLELEAYGRCLSMTWAAM
jgi:hypothetical protein